MIKKRDNKKKFIFKMRKFMRNYSIIQSHNNDKKCLKIG